MDNLQFKRVADTLKDNFMKVVNIYAAQVVTQGNYVNFQEKYTDTPDSVALWRISYGVDAGYSDPNCVVPHVRIECPSLQKSVESTHLHIPISGPGFENDDPIGRVQKEAQTMVDGVLEQARETLAG